MDADGVRKDRDQSVYGDMDGRLDGILSALDSLASGDLAARVFIGEPSDGVDAVAAAVNRLADTLGARVEHAAVEQGDDHHNAMLEGARSTLHDELTGLRNRAFLVDRLAELQTHVERHGGVFSLIVIDMDDFMEVNETVGHLGGDRVLVEIARRLRSSIRPPDMAARLTGDRFAIVLPATTGAEAEQMAARLARELREPIAVRGRSVQPSASIGVVSCEPGHSGEVLRAAEAAIYAAKKAKGTDYQVYRPDMDALTLDRLGMSADLRTAITRGELSLVYQPIVNARRHIAEGVEALLRWQHPERGNVPPSDFIPLAEQSGLIHEIGLWVLETACREMVAWTRIHPAAEPLNLSVNLSMRQLQGPELISKVAEILHRTGMPATRLTLEVTESALAEHLEDAAEPLQRLRELGVRISVDDFGTGYASLNYLRRLPVDEVKIDRSFVEGIAENSREWRFAAAIVRLVKTLGLTTVAEGVESGGQLAHVIAIGCDLAQGYHFGRPGALEGAESLLQAKKR